MKYKNSLITCAVVLTSPILTSCASVGAGLGSAVASGSPMDAAYQRDISAMTRYCTQNAEQLESMVSEVHKLELVHGITTESVTELAHNLLTIVSAYKTRVSCADPFGAYVTLRTGG